MAEIELHVLNGQCLNRHISTIEKVTDEVNAWQNDRNNKPSKINWDNFGKNLDNFFGIKKDEIK